MVRPVLPIAGGVYVSGAVYDYVRGKLDLPFRVMGEQNLKNISEPVRVFAIEPGGSAPKAKSLEADGIFSGLPLRCCRLKTSPATRMTNSLPMG
jgi:hypothetical protein